MAKLCDTARTVPPMDDAASLTVYRRFGLTGREAEVLQAVAHGHSNAEIGLLLGISPGTVKKHLERVYSKLDVNTRLAAALKVSADRYRVH
jgi:DNA-binding CsgD family transcriptional regulator